MNLILISLDGDDISYDSRYYLGNDHCIQHHAATNTADLVLVMESTWIWPLLRGGGGRRRSCLRPVKMAGGGRAVARK